MNWRNVYISSIDVNWTSCTTRDSEWCLVWPWASCDLDLWPLNPQSWLFHSLASWTCEPLAPVCIKIGLFVFQNILTSLVRDVWTERQTTSCLLPVWPGGSIQNWGKTFVLTAKNVLTLYTQNVLEITYANRATNLSFYQQNIGLCFILRYTAEYVTALHPN